MSRERGARRPHSQLHDHRIIGYRDLAKLVIAVERHAIRVAPKDHVRQETREPVTV